MKKLNIIALLTSYDNDQVGDIVMQLEDLKQVFDELELKYTYIDPITDSQARVTYINSKTNVLVVTGTVAAGTAVGMPIISSMYLSGLKICRTE